MFEPRSRRPKHSPNATPAQAVALIVDLREKLATTGLDSGPDTIGWHLEHHTASRSRGDRLAAT